MAKEQKIKVKLVKSLIGQTKKIRDTIKGLGLRKVNSESELLATAENLGMVNKVKHLVKILD